MTDLTPAALWSWVTGPYSVISWGARRWAEVGLDAFARSRGARPSLSAGLWDLDLLPVMSQGPPLLSSPRCTGQTQAGLQHSELMSAPSPCPHPRREVPEEGVRRPGHGSWCRPVDVWISGRVEPSACRGGEAGSSKQAGTAPGPHLPSTPPCLTWEAPPASGPPASDSSRSRVELSLQQGGCPALQFTL